MKVILIITLLLIACTHKEGTAVLDEAYYTSEMKIYAEECAIGPNRINIKCFNRKAKKIPKKYYTHLRKTKDGWEFACIDTTIDGHEEALKKALAARGYEYTKKKKKKKKNQKKRRR